MSHAPLLLTICAETHVPKMSLCCKDGLYERHIRPYFHNIEWIVFVDLDEFLYGRRSSIAEYLHQMPGNVARLEVNADTTRILILCLAMLTCAVST